MLLRLLPAAVRLAQGRARRATGPVPLLAAAAAATSALRALPVLAVAVTVAQARAGAGAGDHRAARPGRRRPARRRGGRPAARRRLPDLTEVAARVARGPGVEAAVAARVADGVPAASPQTAAAVRLVVVDAAARARVLRATGAPGAPSLQRLAATGGTAVPALVRGGDASLRPGLQVTWDGARVPLQVVGTAPDAGPGDLPVVLVDAAAFRRAGAVADPDTVWAAGPGAVSAVRAAAPPDVEVVARADVLAERRAAPLARGLRLLAATTAVVLALLGALGVVLAAAAGAPARATAAARARTLGLPVGALRAVAAGGGATRAGLGGRGLVVGLLAARLTLSRLGLEPGDRPGNRPAARRTVVAGAAAARAAAGRAARRPRRDRRLGASRHRGRAARRRVTGRGWVYRRRARPASDRAGTARGRRTSSDPVSATSTARSRRLAVRVLAHRLQQVERLVAGQPVGGHEHALGDADLAVGVEGALRLLGALAGQAGGDRRGTEERQRQPEVDRVVVEGVEVVGVQRQAADHVRGAVEDQPVRRTGADAGRRRARAPHRPAPGTSHVGHDVHRARGDRVGGRAAPGASCRLVEPRDAGVGARHGHEPGAVPQHGARPAGARHGVDGDAGQRGERARGRACLPPRAAAARAPRSAPPAAAGRRDGRCAERSAEPGSSCLPTPDRTRDGSAP
nr:hypothetical protein [Angustibacter aerolatus]